MHAIDSPLAPEFVEHLRVFASLVHRYVHATRSVSPTRSTPTVTPSVRTTRFRSSAPTDPSGVTTNADEVASVPIVFVELACRRVHALATEEGRHECREN